MLDTQFPRPAGDLGNRNSFPGIPIKLARVTGAMARQVIESDPQQGLANLFPRFLEQARRLQEEGALGITTSCGFLTPMQAWLKSEIDIPVAVSSLQQVPWVNGLLPKGKRCAVITIDKDALSSEHLVAVNVPSDTLVLGMPKQGAFAEMILRHHETGEVAPLAGCDQKRRTLIQNELLRTCAQLPSNIGALVLECTNLPPYRRLLQEQLRLPIFDIQTLVQWFWTGLRSRDTPL